MKNQISVSFFLGIGNLTDSLGIRSEAKQLHSDDLAAKGHRRGPLMAPQPGGSCQPMSQSTPARVRGARSPTEGHGTFTGVFRKFTALPERSTPPGYLASSPPGGEQEANSAAQGPEQQERHEAARRDSVTLSVSPLAAGSRSPAPRCK